MKGRRKRAARATAAPALAPAPRVYPAASDPRQAKGKALRDFVDSGAWRPEWPPRPHPPVVLSPGAIESLERFDFALANTTEALAREFGPWERAPDGTWGRRGP